MPQCVLSAAVSRVQSVAAPSPDAVLVSAFAEGDSEAFAEIVRRHGSMVLGVCRKITRHAHDAEDAAQAAFLVLARRAGSIRAAGLASWLFGVAVNTAREARRRSARHRPGAAVPDVGRCDPDPDFDTRAVIAEELARLPDRYRELLVRCDLEGEAQAAVARRVGLPVGTVYSRLSTARTLLAGRLARRGIAAGLGLLAFPRAAFAFPDSPSKNVTELTEKVMRTGSRWKWAIGAVLAAGVALSAAERPTVEPAPEPREADASKLVTLHAGHIRFLSPGGTLLKRVTAADAKKAGADVPSMTLTVGLTPGKGFTTDVKETFAPHGRVSPDGRVPLATRQGLYLMTPGGKAEPMTAANGQPFYIGIDVTEIPPVVAWSPDGKKAVVQGNDGGGYFDRKVYGQAILDLAAGTMTPTNLPKDHRVLDWSADGKWFLTIRESQKWGFTNGWQIDSRAVCKVSPDGRQVKQLSDGTCVVLEAAISPDGNSVAYMDYRWVLTGKKDAEGEPIGYGGFALIRHDISSGRRQVLASEEGGPRADGKTYHAMPGGVRWSPDGARVAFGHDFSVVGGVSEWRLKTVAADGTDPKTVTTTDRKADGERWKPYQLIDWR